MNLLRNFAKSSVILFAVAMTASACVKDRKADKDDEPDLPTKPSEDSVKAGNSKVGVIDVRVELRDDGMLLQLSGVPKDTTLQCDIDKTPLVPCHDGALFVRPSDGEHVVTATAVKDGQKVAIGASSKFKVLPGTGGAFDDNNNPRNPLTLVPDDPSFVDTMALPMSKKFVAKFRFANKRPAGSCKATIKCQYDSRQSAFWTDCDAGGASYSVSPAIMALGLQSLSVQASCGDDLGPILTMSWYGVPDDYKPLMLYSVKDPQKRHIVSLVKANDCADSEAQVFECAEPNDDDFALCPSGNKIDNPPTGYQVRLMCEGKPGPILKL